MNLIDLKVLDQNGESNDAAVIAAIQEAIALKSKYNIKVINLSLGRPIFESYHLDPLCRAVEAAYHAGIVVAVAAGNLGRNGYSTITSPGNTPEAITVGAMNTMGTVTRGDDQIASYSSRGPTYIDLIAKPDLRPPATWKSRSFRRTPRWPRPIRRTSLRHRIIPTSRQARRSISSSAAPAWRPRA